MKLTMAVLLTLIISMAIGCKGKAVPTGWAKLGLPVKGGEVHDDGGRLDNKVATFMHQGTTMHKQLCGAYGAALKKHDFTIEKMEKFDNSEGTFVQLEQDGDKITLSCSVWEKESVRVSVKKK